MANEAIVLQGKIVPTTPQEIPALFEGSPLPASKAIQTALWIAKNNDLITEKTPLRSIWYAFIKLVTQKILKRVGFPEESYYKSFGDIIRKTGLWYKDFNVLTAPTAFEVAAWARLFPNVVICLEKESYFQVFKNFCDLLGLHLYAGGGMPSLSRAEEISRRIQETDPYEDLNVRTISDYDPAGLNIAANFGEQFKMFFDRENLLVDDKRTAPLPEHYEPDELDLARYEVSKGMIKQKRWQDRKLEREKYGLADEEGMEVESLPARPFDAQMPTGMSPDKAVGQARMRLIMFDDLLESFKIEDVLEKWMNAHFIPDSMIKAEEIVRMNSGYNLASGIGETIKEKLDDLMYVKGKLLLDDIVKVKEEIKDWRKDIIEEYVDDPDKVEKFEQMLREAVAKDKERWDFNWDYKREMPSIPDEIKEYDVSEEIKEVIEENKDYLEGLLEELEEKIKEEKEKYPEDERYKEEFEETETEESSRFTIDDRRNGF